MKTALITALDLIGQFVRGPSMTALLLGAGVYFTVRTRFLPIFRLKDVSKIILRSLFCGNVKKGGISSFEALSTALAGTIGTGNIVGVAAAISIGGPGAVFWMWVSAFFGMMTKYAEIVLALKFRIRTKNGEYSGGAMYYIERGLHSKALARIFACLCLLATFGIGNMAQSNATSGALHDSFGILPLASGIATAVLCGLVIIGGAKRIAHACASIVPIMSVFYICISLAVIFANLKTLPGIFTLIFQSAFAPRAAAGGVSGFALLGTIQTGCSKGIFSNEAGLGSAPIAHASADVREPVEQAVWGIFEVFFDTLVICSFTAIVILLSGVSDAGFPVSRMTAAAFELGLGSLAPRLLSIAMFFFAFSSILCWSLYGEKCLEYLTGRSSRHLIYKFFFLLFIPLGAVTELASVWEISETLNALMAIPNLIALFLLSKIVFKATSDYFK